MSSNQIQYIFIQSNSTHFHPINIKYIQSFKIYSVCETHPINNALKNIKHFQELFSLLMLRVNKISEIVSQTLGPFSTCDDHFKILLPTKVSHDHLINIHILHLYQLEPFLIIKRKHVVFLPVAPAGCRQIRRVRRPRSPRAP